MPVALKIVNQFYPKVKKVVDAKTELLLTVTARDVASAARKNHTGCAVAEACIREQEVDGAIVSTSTAYLVHGDIATRYKVPQRMFREITSFDRGGGMEPGRYHLATPDHPVGTKARKTGRGHSPGPSKTKHIHAHAEGVRDTLPAQLPPPKRKRKSR